MAFLTALLILVSTIFAIVFLWYKKKYRFWGNLRFTHTNPSFPLGDASGIGSDKNLGQIVNHVYKQYPKERFVGFWLLFRPSLLIRDPELAKSVFVRDFMSFHDRGIYVNERDDPLAAHLFSIGGTKWRNIRVKLTPTFTSGKMKMMFPILVECCNQLRSVLDGPAAKGEVIEVKDIVARFTTDVISLSAFGLDTNSLNTPNSDFRHYGQLVFEPNLTNTVRWLLSFLVPDLAEWLKIRFLNKPSSDFFIKAIRDTMNHRETNNIRAKDFMDLLIQLKNKGKLEDADTEVTDKEPTKFTFEEAAAQAFVFFAAGFETSSTTMQFALYELAKSPEIQKKTRQEVRKVMARHNDQLTYECIMEMEYLGRVVDETLRLYPPAPFLQRECNKDYEIPDTDLVLPKGTHVVVDILGLHNDPVHFPNPHIFDPERFTDIEKAKRHHYAYMPFGEGPRNCIGMRFGLMETRVGMATLLNNYEFSVAAETPIPMVFDPKSFVLTPKGGMHLKISLLDDYALI